MWPFATLGGDNTQEMVVRQRLWEGLEPNFELPQWLIERELNTASIRP
jgi:hypothetical protein